MSGMIRKLTLPNSQMRAPTTTMMRPTRQAHAAAIRTPYGMSCAM